MLAAIVSIGESKGRISDPFCLKVKTESFQSEEARNAIKTATIENRRVRLMTVREQRRNDIWHWTSGVWVLYNSIRK